MYKFNVADSTTEVMYYAGHFGHYVLPPQSKPYSCFIKQLTSKAKQNIQFETNDCIMMSHHSIKKSIKRPIFGKKHKLTYANSEWLKLGFSVRYML